MSAKTSHVTIGAFVLGGIALVLIAIALLGSGKLFKNTYAFVSYFDGSVNGLRNGAPVKFKGVEIGKVDHIRIPFRVDHVDQPIAVVYSIDSSIVESVRALPGGGGDEMSGAIANGLRAQLETDSLLTGVQYVSLKFTEDRNPILHEPEEGLTEIPTIPPPLQELETSFRGLVDKIGRTDFEKLFASLNSALDGIDALVRGPELRGTLAALDEALRSAEATLAAFGKEVEPAARRFEAAARSVESAGESVQGGVVSMQNAMASIERVTSEIGEGVEPLLASLKASSDHVQALSSELEKTLATSRVLIDPNAPIAVELRTTLRELSETARSTRALVDYLERNPSALLRGRGEGDK